MYEYHPDLDEPSDTDLIWRYLDFAKFTSLLDAKALFFARPTLFEDAHECLYPDEFAQSDICGTDMQRFAKIAKETHVYVNCWSMNDYESGLLWAKYVKTNLGVAIKSTVRSLKESLVTESNVPQYIGKVRYFNPKPEELKNLFNAIYRKKPIYHDEKELRILLFGFVPSSQATGTYVPISVEKLIEEIYVSPKSGDWFMELVEHIVKDHYHLDKPIKRSDFDG